MIDEDLNIGVLMLGIVATSVICYFFKIMNTARVAVVALLIILLQPHLSDIELTPFVRFATVTAGCLIGLTITVLSSMLIRKLKRKYGIAY